MNIDWKETAESRAKAAATWKARAEDLERTARAAEDMRDASDARVRELEATLDKIHELATWNEEEHDDEEPTEDDMIDALTEIHELSWRRTVKP